MASFTMNTDALSPLFRNVTYVVTDVRRAARRFAFLVPGASFSIKRITLTGGASGGCAISLECATAPVGPRGEYEIRLLQPLEQDPIFHRHLTAAGPGLHHITFGTSGLERAAKRLAASSLPLAEMVDEDGCRCLYYRCQELGGVIELNDRAGGNREMKASGVARRPLASYFLQVAYIVNDVAAARQWTESVLGCEVATARDMVQGPAWNLKFRGKPAPNDFSLKIVIGKLGAGGEGQIELLEPQRNDNVLAEFLDDHGPGLNHIAFAVPDYDAHTVALRSTGVPPLKEIHLPGTAHSSYFDCSRDELSTIEVFATGPNA
jgi:catechol 2,3-dioxygenase-like lactoylglutathione lyase family enzyme